MKTLGLTALAAVILLAAAFYGTHGTVRDPDDPPTARAAEAYIAHVESRDLPGDPAAVRAWVEEVSLVSFMDRTDGIPAVTGTEPIGGPWGEVGARRWALLETGDRVVDRITALDAQTFQYQVYGFTAPARMVVDHIAGTLRYDPVDTGTRVTWTYAVAPRSVLVRPFARRFVTDRFAPFMAQTMDNLQAAATARHAEAK